jgi:hypothetical protein
MTKLVERVSAMRMVSARGRPRILGVFAAAVVLGGAVTTVAVANAASAADDRCPANNFCMYMKKDFRGGPITTSDLRGIKVGLEANLAPEAVAAGIYSIVNNSDRGITLFDHPGGRGKAFHVKPWHRYTTLGGFNNRTESVVF